MKPKEKAKELVIKYSYITGDLIYGFTYSKQCALIAIEEIINLYTNDDVVLDWKYWQEVKQEIEKL